MLAKQSKTIQQCSCTLPPSERADYENAHADLDRIPKLDPPQTHSEAVRLLLDVSERLVEPGSRFHVRDEQELSRTPKLARASLAGDALANVLVYGPISSVSGRKKFEDVLIARHVVRRSFERVNGCILVEYDQFVVRQGRKLLGVAAVFRCVAVYPQDADLVDLMLHEVMLQTANRHKSGSADSYHKGWVESASLGSLHTTAQDGGG
jgi:hypothetical protein